MDELIGWLREQLDDDERVARAATSNPRWSLDEHGDGIVWAEGLNVVADRLYPDDAKHIARWDPARVLAEVDAKRQRIDWIEGELADDSTDETVQWLARLEALPYAGRPGYREEWRP